MTYAAIRHRTVPPKRKLRALTDLDGRTSIARQARKLQASIASDLGGDDVLSTAQRVLIQRVALLDAVVIARPCGSLAVTTPSKPPQKTATYARARGRFHAHRRSHS